MVLGGDNFIIKLRHATEHYLLREHLPIVVMVVVISGVTVVGLAVLVGGAAVVVASVRFTMIIIKIKSSCKKPKLLHNECTTAEIVLILFGVCISDYCTICDSNLQEENEYLSNFKSIYINDKENMYECRIYKCSILKYFQC